MAEWSWFWGGSSVGDATTAPYDDDEFTDTFNWLFQYDRAIQGVVYSGLTGYTGNLAVSGTGPQMNVAAGIAIVDGKVYRNTSVVNVSTAGAGNYSVVLRKDWVAQTVRIAIRSLGVTQNDGTLWEIKLADINVNGAGVHTLYDRRQFVNLPLVARQGNVTDWAEPDVTNYTGNYLIQCGSILVSIGNGSIGYATLTFPVALAYKPVILVSITDIPASLRKLTAYVDYSTMTGSTADIYVSTVDSSIPSPAPQMGASYFVHWIIVGTIGG